MYAGRRITCVRTLALHLRRGLSPYPPMPAEKEEKGGGMGKKRGGGEGGKRNLGFFLLLLLLRWRDDPFICHKNGTEERREKNGAGRESLSSSIIV